MWELVTGERPVRAHMRCAAQLPPPSLHAACLAYDCVGTSHHWMSGYCRNRVVVEQFVRVEHAGNHAAGVLTRREQTLNAATQRAHSLRPACQMTSPCGRRRRSWWRLWRGCRTTPQNLGPRQYRRSSWQPWGSCMGILQTPSPIPSWGRPQPMAQRSGLNHPNAE